MRRLLILAVVVQLSWPPLLGLADVPQVFCVGTESGGDGPARYAYEVHSAGYPIVEFHVGTNDINVANYLNVLTPPGWQFKTGGGPALHWGGSKTPHGQDSPGPCFCLPHGTVRWTTDDLQYAVESFTFGFDHPWRSEDMSWTLITRPENTEHTFREDWDAPLGMGYGPVHGPKVLELVPLDVDIKPGSWPNPLNTKSKGVLPVAVLGTDEFDAMTIDPASISLSLEGVENTVSPLRWSYEDVGTPYEGDPCSGHDLGPDGFMDLALKFDTEELVAALALSDLQGECLALDLTGNLLEEFSGTAIQGSDWIRLLHPGDANADGFVGADDLTLVLNNWGRSGLGRAAGDLDGNGIVDGSDYSEVISYWSSSSASSEPTTTPEPATLALLLIGALALLRRRL